MDPGVGATVHIMKTDLCHASYRTGDVLQYTGAMNVAVKITLPIPSACEACPKPSCWTGEGLTVIRSLMS